MSRLLTPNTASEITWAKATQICSASSTLFSDIIPCRKRRRVSLRLRQAFEFLCCCSACTLPTSSWQMSQTSMAVRLWATPVKTLISYVADHREALQELEKHGAVLLDTVAGWLLLRKARKICQTNAESQTFLLASRKFFLSLMAIDVASAAFVGMSRPHHGPFPDDGAELNTPTSAASDSGARREGASASPLFKSTRMIVGDVAHQPRSEGLEDRSISTDPSD